MGAPKDPVKNAEWRRKLSEASEGEKNPNYGKRGKSLSETHRNKISKSMQNKVRSKEHCKHISESKEGKPRPDMVGDNNPSKRPEVIAKKMGDKSHLWKGGISFEPYCEKFNRPFKERVRKFFERTCVECGKTEEESGRKSDVHHVNFDKQTCCNDSKPLYVALCHSCHLKTNHNRAYWEKHFTEMINDKYGGCCYLPRNGVEI